MHLGANYQGGGKHVLVACWWVSMPLPALLLPYNIYLNTSVHRLVNLVIVWVLQQTQAPTDHFIPIQEQRLASNWRLMLIGWTDETLTLVNLHGTHSILFSHPFAFLAVFSYMRSGF